MEVALIIIAIISIIFVMLHSIIITACVRMDLEDKINKLENKIAKYESLDTINEVKDFYEKNKELVCLYEIMIKQRKERQRDEYSRY